jgi:hypothetical protein
MLARSHALNRWQQQSQPGARSLLLSHGNDVYSVQRLHGCRMPQARVFLRLEICCQTAEFGQKLVLGLLETENLKFATGSAGIAICIDPETGAVEDLHNGSGVIGYVTSAPMQPESEVRLALEAWFYGQVLISRVWVGEQTVLHPALLLDPGQNLFAIAGGEITDGPAPRFQSTELTLLPIGTSMPMHG